MPESPSNALLAAAAVKRGIDWEMVHPGDLLVDAQSGEPELVQVNGPKLKLPERFFTRLGSSAQAAHRHPVAILESLGVKGMNRAAAIADARDKAATLRRLAAAGLPHPRTWVVSSTKMIDLVIARQPKGPYVVKIPVGCQGLGTALLDSPTALRSVVEILLAKEEVVLIQEFIAEAKSADLRVFVVGGKAWAAMRRQGQDGEFRSNLHRGGKAKALEPTGEIATIAVAAAEAMGLEVAGVDLLESERGPLIIEVNAAPGLAGIHAATGIDLAAVIIDHLMSAKFS